MNLGPQHMVERGQEMITDIQGKLLDGLYLYQVRITYKAEQRALSKTISKKSEQHQQQMNVNEFRLNQKSTRLFTLDCI